jgi:hypothetical protein
VTRDRALRDRVRAIHGQTRTTDWLLDGFGAAQRRTGGSTATTPPTRIGRGRASTPTPREPVVVDGDEEARPRWQPGRGATRKRGNPRRGAKATRHR